MQQCTQTAAVDEGRELVKRGEGPEWGRMLETHQVLREVELRL